MKYIIVVLLSAAFALLMAQTAPALTDRVVAQETPVTSKNVKAEAQAPLQPKPEKKKATVTRPDSAKSKKKLATPRIKPEPTPLDSRQQLMQAAGIHKSDWNAVDYIISHESSWRPTVYNNEGCVGLGQRCPASTLLNDCPDLEPVCQLRHFSRYAVERYGGWQNAYSTWVSQSWW